MARHGVYYRSLYGYVHTYNRLPEFLIGLGSVKEFQVHLTKMARKRCSYGDPAWRSAWKDVAFMERTLMFMEE